MASKMKCPLCERTFSDKPHPKDSSYISAHIQVYDHLRVYHADEIKRRLEANPSP